SCSPSDALVLPCSTPRRQAAAFRQRASVVLGTRWDRRCAGINRHAIGNERVLQERSSESILTPNLAGRIVRCGPKRRQGQRRAGYGASKTTNCGRRPCRLKGKATRCHGATSRAGRRTHVV